MKGARLKNARKEAKLSVDDVACKMHKSIHTVKSWESSDDRQPRTIKEIQRLCRLLNINVEWYLSGMGAKRTIPEEQEILALYSKLKDEQKTAILILLRAMS